MPVVRSSSTQVGSIDEARRLAAELIDAEQVAAFRSGRADDVSCRSGCTTCCAQSVPVGPAELRAIEAAIDELDHEAQHRVRQRIRERAGALREQGFAAGDLQDRSGAERREVAKRYFATGVMCPLLDGDTCIVRHARPLICRDYLVTSDPKHCESIANEQTVRVRLGRNVVGGFAELQRSIGDPESLILALALDEPIDDSASMQTMSMSACVRSLAPPTTTGNTTGT